MLSTVANTLFNRLIDAFPATRPYSRQDFTREPMPKPVAEFLEQSLHAPIPELNPSLESWFDLDHPEVKQARLAFGDVLLRHQHVPAGKWSEILRAACHQTVSYLVRPGTTLTDAVFGDERGPLPAETVFERMKPYSSYSYFRDVVAGYFEQKNVGEIDRERFSSLVRRTDRQMTSDYGTNEWLRLLEPLFAVSRRVPELSGGIPVELLRSFFEEKQAADIVRRLDSHFPKRGVVKESNLHVLFEHEEIEVHEVSKGRPPQPEERAAAPRTEDRTAGPVPLWKQYERGQGARPEKEAEPVSTATEPLWKRFRKEPEPAEATSELAPLERSVLGDRGARNRDLFVKHLFGGSVEAYTEALRALRRAQNWSQASQIIAQEVFLKHKVNIYSDPAVAFTDAAEAVFR